MDRHKVFGTIAGLLATGAVGSTIANVQNWAATDLKMARLLVISVPVLVASMILFLVFGWWPEIKAVVKPRFHWLKRVVAKFPFRVRSPLVRVIAPSPSGTSSAMAAPEPVPTLAPPIEYTLNPERARPAVLIEGERYEGITVCARRIKNDLLLEIHNRNPAGKFGMHFRVLRLEGYIRTGGNDGVCFPFAPPEGALFHPTAARAIYMNCGLGFRDIGRVRIGHCDSEEEIALYSYHVDDGAPCMKEVFKIQAYEELGLLVEVEADVVRITHDTYLERRKAECRARCILRIDKKSRVLVSEIESKALVIGSDNTESPLNT